MYHFQDISEIIGTLNEGKKLIDEIFKNRKRYDYEYEQALELLGEGGEVKIQRLIDKGIIKENGQHLEIEDQFLSFFEELMQVNETINISSFNEHIKIIKENIDYFSKENIQQRKQRYFNIIKKDLGRIGKICSRNIDDLIRNIDTTFKTEENYQIKLKKLENFKGKTEEIQNLIAQSRHLIDKEEVSFFVLSADEELQTIVVELKKEFNSANHNLVEIQRQLLQYINQVRHNSQVVEKVKQLKLLMDQVELEAQTNIKEVLNERKEVLFEKRKTYPLKLDLDILENDEVYQLIKEINQNQKNKERRKAPSAEAIDVNLLNQQTESVYFINHEEVKRSFLAQGNDLFNFVFHYEFPFEVSYVELVGCYYKIINYYSNEIEITDDKIRYKDRYFAKVYPKRKKYA
ncbi:AAA family ATPase [Flammeovirga aprica]|uniref:DUF3375 domain-containing protein n=1 Tax=Flammeovirga aprica JL-4 TaxID=694437 RepID=A0A7X9S1G7_9BACT|nr:hypothetical protein [Flammeovirga aprica]NME72677.1 hypothetical protein [Flammeovirga aprica JL-4]